MTNQKTTSLLSEDMEDLLNDAITEFKFRNSVDNVKFQMNIKNKFRIGCSLEFSLLNNPNFDFIDMDFEDLESFIKFCHSTKIHCTCK